MHRRRLLVAGTGVPLSLSGCLGYTGGDGGATPEGVPVSVTSRAEQPDVPVEYDVELVAPVATADRPARLRVTLTNPTDEGVALGEERAVQFHHVSSDGDELYLHPAGEGPWEGPVEPGCWQLTERVAVPEYYGVVPLDAGESVRGESYVYGHPELPADTCLPAGEHPVRTTGVAGADEEALDEGTHRTEFEWGFTLRIGE